MIRAEIYGINIILETDQPTFLKGILEFYATERQFNWKTKKMDFMTVHKKIYNRTKKDPRTGLQYYEIGVGWAAYLLNILGPFVAEEDANRLKDAIYQDQYRTVPFSNLRDQQNEDVLHILKYKFGLCTVQTGYGKTEVIATLANYFSTDLGKKVLIVAPGSKAQDELVKRLDTRFGIKVSKDLVSTASSKKATEAAKNSKVFSLMTSGFLTRNVLKDKTTEPVVAAELRTFDVILSDEVEYCINPAGNYIFGNAVNATARYAFSGTADKGNGNMISFQNGLKDPSVSENLGLIRFFGPSLVYRRPLDRILNLIDIRTRALYSADIFGQTAIDNKNLYLKILMSLFTCPEVCNLIVDIAKRFKNLFIPINFLQGIIDGWIENYFKGVLRILLVCGEGYIYYDLDGNKTSLTLSEACQYIKDDKVDVIPSTSAGFRALDFPNLSNILLLSGKIAGSVLQQIGRVSRQSEMTIITISPDGKKKIPVYSKGCKERSDMILDYYRYCDIRQESLSDYEFNIKYSYLPRFQGELPSNLGVFYPGLQG
jgi:hypothetical protein